MSSHLDKLIKTDTLTQEELYFTLNVQTGKLKVYMFVDLKVGMDTNNPLIIMDSKDFRIVDRLENYLFIHINPN